MNRKLVSELACPQCGVAVEVESVFRRFQLRGQEHVDEGVLRCQAEHRFPILDEVPRLVEPSRLELSEQGVLGRSSGAWPETIEPVVLDEPAAMREIQEAVEAQYGSSAASRARAASHASYLAAEYRGENKQKYARLLASLGLTPSTILDVGGSLPGTLRCLVKEFDPKTAVVADLGVEHAATFKSEDRRITLVRASAEALPFRSGSFDLVVSTFLLEHVPHWKKAVEAMARIGREVFVAYGPNRSFPFEVGHLNAPLAGTLPKPIAKYIAFLWLGLLGRGRSLLAIERQLAGMSYISSRQFRRHARRLGLEPANLFTRLVDEVASDRSAPATGPRNVIRNYPSLAHAAARVLETAGLEPQVYHLLRRG